ncbi:MAG: hypothetical protein C5S41_05510 [Candidatus Methanomarinus sp.]|jgi:hypothetical protein|nr:MAG: hypothetical protein C5S41_05510 [ANME-2 cluster archaeon]KAF5425044.1 hypothetical protein C5S42_11615 [ANME-2 cluster archaeon]
MIYMPGFEILFAVTVLLVVAYLLKKKKTVRHP